MAAGKNESDFINRTSTNGKPNISGKLFFSNSKNAGEKISVDGHFIYNGKLYLIEIDSGNYAKLVAGQYTLLNILLNQKPIKVKKSKFTIGDCVFVVVHYYKNYNVKRTTNALKLVRPNLKFIKTLDFKVFHENSIAGWNQFVRLL